MGFGGTRPSRVFGLSALISTIGLVFALVFSPAASARYASIVIDAESGEVLHAINPDTRNYPASLTKMMTLYMVFEALHRGDITLDKKFKVSAKAARRSPSKLGLKRGESITVRNAILALVTKSANDVATVIAEGLGKTEHAFAKKMSARARAIGMSRSDFANASGLPNRRQKSTARDMATLARALITDYPQYYQYFSATRFDFRGRSYSNHNRFMKRYAGADGLKTGYIHASGYNLAASVRRGDRRLVGVVLGGRTSRSRDRHMARLFDRAFAFSRPAIKPNFAATRDRPKKERRAGRMAALAKRSWSVQVGAFKRFAQAHLAVTRAARNAPALLPRSRFYVQPVKSENGILYRARIIGLDAIRARAACKILRKKKLVCEALPPNVDLQTAQADG